MPPPPCLVHLHSRRASSSSVSPPRLIHSRRRRTVKPNRAFPPWPSPPELRRAPGSPWPGRLRPVIPPLLRASIRVRLGPLMLKPLMVWLARALACRRATAQLHHLSLCLATVASRRNNFDQVARWVRVVGGKPLGVLASSETSPATRSRQSKSAPVFVQMTGGVGSTGRACVAADLGIPTQVHLAFSFGFCF
jgi:hypothetical protein